MSGTIQPVIVEGLDPVLIIRLFPEAAGITDGEAQALEQGIATMEAGALLEASQYEPVLGVADAEAVPAAPTNVHVPYVGQTADTLNCTMGEWTGEPTSYAYQWKMDGANVGSGGADYIVTGADVGKTATCVVSATNAVGTTEAPPSNGVVVVAPAR